MNRLTKDTLFDEIKAFYEQQKDNAEEIKKLGHVEYRMWEFIRRIAIRGGENMNLILKIAEADGRDYITPEDVSAAIENYPNINDVRLDLLEILGGGVARVEDYSLCAFIAWRGAEIKGG